MSIKPSHPEDPAVWRTGEVPTDAKPLSRRAARLRFDWARQRIDTLQRQLADEFATEETRPLIDEVEVLTREIEALKRALAGPG